MRQSFIRCLLPVLAFLLPQMLPGQIVSFQKSIGNADNESAYDVLETHDGYLLAGETMNANTGVSSALLIEIDKNGAILWQKSYPQFNEGGFRYVARANDGGYVAWGSVFTPDDLSSNALLVKVDAAGNLVWHQTVGEPGFGDIPTGAIIPVSDGYLLSGGKINIGYFQPFILRVDNQGQTVWSKFTPAPSYSVMRACYLSDSLLYLGGTVDGLGCRRIMDTYSGAIMESREYRVDMTNWIADMQPGPGGSQIMAGQISRDVPGQIRIDAWLQKTDAGGVVEWAKTYKKGYYNVFESLLVRPDGSSIAILNYINEPGGIDFNSMIVAADAGGNLLWATDFSGNNVYGRLSKIIQTADGGLLAVGQLRDRNNAQVQTDMHIVKMDSAGKLQSCCRVTPNLVVDDVPVELKMTGINESDYEPTVPLLFATSDSPDLPSADFCTSAQPVFDSTLIFCPGETISIGSNMYSQPGIVTLQLPSTTGGCDTLATYTLQYSSDNQVSNLQLQCPADIAATIPAGQGTLTINYDLPLAGSDCVCPNLPLDLVAGPASGSAFGPGTYTVCYRAQDDCGSEKTCCFNISIDEDQACDSKIAGCLQFELRAVNTDANQNRVYRIRVANLCDPALKYLYIQVPDGVQAASPAGGSVFTTPAGHEYAVKNPNFSPFASIRFQPLGPGLSGGASDVFRYVLPPQTAPQYIHVAARLTNGTYYEAYLNTFFCPVGTELPKPAEERGAAQAGTLQLVPNPATPGDTWVLQGMDVPEGALLLYDASGRLLLRSAIADNRVLTNVLAEATGLCFFRVFSEGHFAGSGKVLIGN